MAVLIASDVGKDIAGTPLFRGVSFTLERGDRMTLSGRNGAGKTTLLRVLAGEASYDSGELSLGKGVRMALHDQRPPRERGLLLGDYVLSGRRESLELEQELQRLEQAMAGGDERALDRYADVQARFEAGGGYGWRERALAFGHGLGFDDADLARPLDTFSGGQLTRASLARALAAEADLLLLDEPTNHLDLESLEWLERTLVALDSAIVLVAHDRWFLEAVGTSVLELQGGRGRFFKGPWHAWRREQAARELALGRAIERQQAEIARMERFVERFRAKATKARQAQDRVKKLDKIERIERDPRDGESLAFSFGKVERAGRVIFELEDGRVEIGDRTLLDDAQLWLERGEHVSLVGANGTGKTTLVETLVEQHPLAAGKLRRGHNVTVGYLSQHADELEGGGARTVLEACQKRTGLTPGKARALLGRFLFSGDDAEKPLAGLSGGERRRLTLAIVVSSGANVLVLDEPTNHLDIESREALEDALRDFPGSLILVSHDRALLDAVGSRTIAIEDGTLQSYVGGWPEYVRAREERKESGASSGANLRGSGANLAISSGGSASPKNGKENGKSGVKGKRAKAVVGEADPADANAKHLGRSNGPSKNEIARRARLEREIAAAEEALARLEEELADPSAWEDPERAAQSTERHAQAKLTIEELYARWEKTAP